MIRSGIMLVLYLVAGYVLGDLLAWLLLTPVALVKHLTDHWVGTVVSVGGAVGAAVGFLKWRARAAPADHWGVHGSAHWASGAEVRSLIHPDGLIVGRENRNGGELLRRR